MGPIVGIGELLWDVYSDGRKVAGGAPFNFAFHCHQLGHEAVIVSRVGNDDLGKELREEVKRLGMSDEFVQTDYDHPTGTVEIKLDKHAVPQYQIVRDVAWDNIEIEKIIENKKLHNPVVTCFGTVAQRNRQSRTAIQLYIRMLSIYTNSIRILDMNLRDRDFGAPILRPSLLFAHWVKLNIHELKILAPRTHHDAVPERITPNEFYWMTEDAVKSYSTRESYRPLMIVTDGDAGVTVIDDEFEFHQPAAPATVLDTVGAGDAFTAAMVVMHLEGLPLRECARFANHYAARVCEHRGATPKIDRREVELAAFGKSG